MGRNPFTERKKTPKPKHLTEPQYVDDEEMIPVNQQKWKIPKPGLETEILTAARPLVKNPRYTDHKEKKDIQNIAKGALSLQAGIVSRYPLEWVKFCIEWCHKLWKDGKPMNIDNLIKYINNVDKMNDWIAKWASKNHVALQYPGKVGKDADNENDTNY
jgi:hypothetical protein